MKQFFSKSHKMVVVGMAGVSLSVAGAAEITRMMPLPGDYTSMWWAEGFPGVIPEAPPIRRISTGSYSFAMDTKSMRITELGPVAAGTNYRAFVTGTPPAISNRPSAELGLAITTGGKTYRCIQGGEITRHGGPRLIVSGQFLQRADVTDLVFATDDGEKLNVHSRFETAAWPDRMSMILSAQPGEAGLVAGELSFGKVGGGYGLDGSGGLVIPHAPALDCEKFTLEFWMFVPTDPVVSKVGTPWLVCKNLNELAEGNFGITYHGGKVRGRINIGGGKEGKVETTAGAESDLKANAWNHLALSYDGDFLKLYVNGKFGGEKKVGRVRKLGTHPLTFGRRGDTDSENYRFRGAVDEIRMYDRALVPAEVIRRFHKPGAAISGMVFKKGFLANGTASESMPRETWTTSRMEVTLSAENSALNLRAAKDFGESGSGVPNEVFLGFKPATLEAVKNDEAIVVEAFERKSGAARKVVFDSGLLCHRVDIGGMKAEEAPGAEPPGNDNLERLRVVLSNSADSEKTVRILFEKPSGGFSVTGVSAVLRDSDGNPTGIPIQLSKNWHNDSRAGKYLGTWLHAVTQMRLPAASKTELELTVSYAHWGGVAAASHAQLSLIGWGSNQHWSQSALGSWGESICYEPSQAQANSSITDIRPMMVNAGKGAEKWKWTANIGGGDFFRLFDTAGNRKPHSAMQTGYPSHGPCLTDVVFAGKVGDGISHSENVSLARTDDIVRGIYKIRMDVEKTTDFSRFVIFQIGADTYNFTREMKMAFGDKTGLLKEWQTTAGGNTYHTKPAVLEGRVPWISLHEAVIDRNNKFGATANRGIVIRSWKAKLGGKDSKPWIAERGTDARRGNSSSIDIVPPPGVTRLEPGDYVEATIEHIVMPQAAAEYYGPNTGLRSALESHQNTWRMIHREAMGNDLDVEVTIGTLERIRPDIRIKTSDDLAELTLAHGLAYVPITFSGLKSHRGYKLEIDGEILDQSVHGNDFWQTDFDPADATWSRTYNIPAPGASKSVLRFSPEN